MKIQIIQSIAGHADPRYDLADFSFAPGSVIEINDFLAEAWVASGVAIKAAKGDKVTMPAEVYTLRAQSAVLIAESNLSAAE